MGISVLALKFLTFIIGLFPSFDLGSIPQVENVSDVLNIFAWVNFFIPSTLILALLALTASFYAFRFVYQIIKDIII